MTHICVSKLTIIGSDNGLSPSRRQAIIWTNAGKLLIWTLGTNFSEILGKIHSFSLKKMHLKMSSAKGRLFSLGLNELTIQYPKKTMTFLFNSWQHCVHRWPGAEWYSVIISQAQNLQIIFQDCHTKNIQTSGQISEMDMISRKIMDQNFRILTWHLWNKHHYFWKMFLKFQNGWRVCYFQFILANINIGCCLTFHEWLDQS